jgi:hypothetical protein
MAATELQTSDARPQTSDPKANHREHRVLKPEGTEMIEMMAKNNARHE